MPRYAASATRPCSNRQRSPPGSSRRASPFASRDSSAAHHLVGTEPREVANDGSAEPAALHRGSLGHEPGRGVEPVEPRGEERLHGRRDLDVDLAVADPPAVDDRAAVAEHRRDLSEEQRVALGGRADAVDDRRRCASELVLREPARVLRRERGQRDGERSAASPPPTSGAVRGARAARGTGRRRGRGAAAPRPRPDRASAPRPSGRPRAPPGPGARRRGSPATAARPRPRPTRRAARRRGPARAARRRSRRRGSSPGALPGRGRSTRRRTPGWRRSRRADRRAARTSPRRRTRGSARATRSRDPRRRRRTRRRVATSPRPPGRAP